MENRIYFDSSNNPITPTFVLAISSGKKLGGLKVVNINSIKPLKEASEVSFVVYKTMNAALWDRIVDFKLVWCKEYDMWYQIKVDIHDTGTQIYKNVTCTQLSYVELGQTMLYNIEINTEDDIAREDYKIPTTLFNQKHPEASLLNRILEKAPHYKIIHVDSTLKNIERSFSFDDKAITDAFDEIAEEIGCIFILHCNSDKDGNINRGISVYDMQTSCYDCGYRGEYTSVCPECASTNLYEGYGEDTTIFITSDELGNDITFTTDNDSVKNCFKLECGDDLMTATVRNCNPNGSDYIWYIADYVKEDMSDELVQKLEDYDSLYSQYQNDFTVNIDSDLLDEYNQLIQKYKIYKADLTEISSAKGFSNLMSIYYDTIDFNLYLESELMPTVEMSGTTASNEAAYLANNLSSVSVQSTSKLSLSTANSAVLNMAKVIVRSTYKIEIKQSALNDLVWTGNFTITNYSDDTDTADTENISVTINSNYESFVRQKIDKLLNKEDDSDLSVTGLFDMDYDAFCSELKKYCLNRLTSFHDACQSCIDIMIEQGVADKDTWSTLGSEENLYNKLYLPYLNKLDSLEAEMQIRDSEIDTVKKTQKAITDIRDNVQSILDFQSYLGEDLWKEFCTFRREDKYSNDNFISDGLNNAQLIKRAMEFIKTAKDEIYKSAEKQHSISCGLNNLLKLDKFKKLVDYFETGNWIRIRVDKNIYKLRLTSYSIDYNNLENISVEFSDVLKLPNGLSDQRSIIEKASSMASSYSYVQRQASKGGEANETIADIIDNGLDATNTKIIGGADSQTQTWDSHGMLFRKYNEITDDYDDIQLKIINSTIAITDDGWKTTKTAIGNMYYRDYKTDELKNAYGINAEILFGKFLLGESLGIYNESGNLTFDNDGLNITNGINTVIINPNSNNLFTLKNNSSQIFYVDNNGNGYFKGDINAKSGSFGAVNPFIIGDNGIDCSVAENGVYHKTEKTVYFEGDTEYINDGIGFEIIKAIEHGDEQHNTIAAYIHSGYVYVYFLCETNNDNSENDDDIQIKKEHRSFKKDFITSDIDVSNNVVITKHDSSISYKYFYSLTKDGINVNNDAEEYFKKLIAEQYPDVSMDTVEIKDAYVSLTYSWSFDDDIVGTHIGTDYFDYSNSLIIKGGKVTINDELTINDEININNNMYLNNGDFIGKIKTNNYEKYWRLHYGSELEIATANTGTEGIYVRQYSGDFENIDNTLMLLDSNGNTDIPNKLFVNTISRRGGASYLELDSPVVIKSKNTYLGYASQTNYERRLIFSVNEGTHKHSCRLYGGDSESTTGIGLYDSLNKHAILVYNDVTNTLSVNTVENFSFKTHSGSNARPTGSNNDNKKKVSHFATSSTALSISGQWGDTTYSNRSIAVASSDIRLKENVSDCDINALELIDRIKMHSFDWKQAENNKHQKIGFIADELEQLDNMLSIGGGYDEDGTMNVKTVNTFYMMGYIVKAIQELKKENNELKRKLNEV